MSTDYGYQGSIVTDGSTPIQNLLIVGGSVTNTAGTSLQTLLENVYINVNNVSTTAAGTALNKLFSEQGFPKDFNSLILLIRKQAYTDKGESPPASALNTANFSTAPEVVTYINNIMTNAALKSGLIQDFYTSTNPSSVSPSISITDAQFAAALLSNFLGTFSYDSTTYTSGLLALKGEFSKYAQNIVTVQTAGNLGVGTATTYKNFNSYQDFFNAFKIAGDTNAAFVTFFANFTTSFINNKGYFDPSTAYDAWTKAVVARYVQSFTGGFSAQMTTVSDALVGGKHKTATLNAIFSLLVKLIGSLQNVTAAQADRLKVLANWQTAYTDLQGQIKYALKTGGNPTIADDTNRNSFNEFNSTLIQTMQARKSLVSDEAKNQQTNVSQSNDAVNQQTSQATSIIQELSTILQAIYR